MGQIIHAIHHRDTTSVNTDDVDHAQSPPAPWAHAHLGTLAHGESQGTMPKIMASVVIRIGRGGAPRAAISKASCRDIPSSCARMAKSTQQDGVLW